jgi:sporulation protein YlmC with PRC-barrel domain
LRISDLLDRPVVDVAGVHLGKVHDVRLVQDGPPRGSALAALRMEALVVGGGALSVRLGYHRHRVRGPAPLRALFAALERRAVVVPWHQVVVTDDGPLHLRCGRAELPGLEEV